MNKSTVIVWFRKDLRLHDNPAWTAALNSGLNILPLYLHCPDEDGRWRRGEASNWWLHHALKDLSQQLSSLGHSLVIRQSNNSQQAIQQVIEECSAVKTLWNRNYEPAAVKRDTAIKAALKASGYEVQTFNGNLLFDPLKIANKSSKPFKVFTAFWKHCSAKEIKAPIPAPSVCHGKPLQPPPSTTHLDELSLLPSIPWDSGISKFWEPTRTGGLKLLSESIAKSIDYQSTRDTPSVDGTSRLSPYLHFGQISPAEFYHQVLDKCTDKEASTSGILRQLFWREFSSHLLFHFAETQEHPLRSEFELFPWQLDTQLLSKWQRGETGYPLVDAGMRQLWETGWMHNRVRMVVSSFLVKHLLQPWQEGAHWFWDTLVDADLANNTMGWQWIGGCGADASPYFRVFNPILQSKKFDPKGDYIRKWVPELATIPDQKIHTPWELEPLELLSYGIQLGTTYPHPIITHEAGRKQALEAYQIFKGRVQQSDKII